MKGLFLHGANCGTWIWEKCLPFFENTDIVCAEYPPDATRNAQSVADVARALGAMYGGMSFDFILGHSMGGVVALYLANEHGVSAQRILLAETNLVPANAFYRNLLTMAHMNEYGESVAARLRADSAAYSAALLSSLREGFDYTALVNRAEAQVFAIYGDRSFPEYERRISDLCLSEETLARLRISFVPDACHLPMIENPRGFAQCVAACLQDA